MSFLVVTKNCCGLREEHRKKGAGKKAYGKHRRRENYGKKSKEKEAIEWVDELREYK